MQEKIRRRQYVMTLHAERDEWRWLNRLWCWTWHHGAGFGTSEG